MKESRAGESLWSEWQGYLFDQKDEAAFVFFTIEHVNLADDVVKRALASAVQRSGAADSLGAAFRVVEAADGIHGHAGAIDEDSDLTVCDIDGETFYGEFVDEVFPITWVEISA